MAVAAIGKKDLVWSILATFFKIGAGVLLFPFILSKLSAETVGVWTIFTTVTMITMLFDFGFNTSFARNISYVFSGVKFLRKEGYEEVSVINECDINYKLLKSTIRAMRYFYSRMSLVMLFLLLTIGSYYIYTLMQDYQGDVREVYISWVLLCLINCYNLYTLYYESLLNGRGLVKRANQIILIGNLIYLVAAAILIMLGNGLIAIVSAQILSVITVRLLSYYSFFDKKLRYRLSQAEDEDYKTVLRVISPNAIKVGLTTLGGFIINRSSTFIGSLYVSLSDMASYGITLQLLGVVSSLALVVTRVYMPKVFQWRVECNIEAIKRIYYISSVVLLIVFLLSGLVIGLCGNMALSMFHSSTYLVSGWAIVLITLQYYLESNHISAAQYLLSKNEVPFFKASLLSAGATIILLFIFVVWLRMGLIGMILAPMLSQLAYQNWKWPYEVMNELKNVKLGKREE